MNRATIQQLVRNCFAADGGRTIVECAALAVASDLEHLAYAVGEMEDQDIVRGLIVAYNRLRAAYELHCELEGGDTHEKSPATETVLS